MCVSFLINVCMNEGSFQSAACLTPCCVCVHVDVCVVCIVRVRYRPTGPPAH